MRYNVAVVPPAPLACHPVLDTRHVEEAEARLSSLLAPCRVLRAPERSDFRVTLNAVQLGRTTLVYNGYAAESRLETELEEDCLYFTLGRGASSRFAGQGGPLATGPDRFVLPRTGSRQTIDRGAGSELLVLRVSEDDVARHLRRLTGGIERRRPVFASECSTRQGGGRSLLRLLLHVVEELQDEQIGAALPAEGRAYDDLLLSRLLSLPHSLGAAITRGSRHAVMPDLVGQAEEYLRENLTRAVTISDILAICECSRTVLYRAFRCSRDYTPMQFLTEQRLQCARRQLRNEGPEVTVATIALSSGFGHLGRFAEAYRGRFGELPSQVRKGRLRGG